MLADMGVGVETHEVPTNIEESCKVELTELQTKFREMYDKSNAAFEDINESSYYFVACFQTRAQVEEFFRLIGMPYAKCQRFVDGLELAAHCRVTVKSPTPPLIKIGPKSTLAELAQPLK